MEWRTASGTYRAQYFRAVLADSVISMLESGYDILPAREETDAG